MTGTFIKAFPIVLAALFGSSVTAGATPVTFNFSGGTGQQAGAMNFFNSSGINLTVSSNTFNNSGSAITGAGKVGRWQDGLGTLDGQSNDAHYVDGSGKNDLLSFYFSQTVKILAINFSYNDSNDNFAFFFDKDKNNNLANDLVWKNKDIPGSSFYGTYSFAALNPVIYVGQLFGIGAFYDDDEFKIYSVTVEAVHTSTVPLPPAALLLISGLAGIAGLNRRRKNKAA